MTNFDSVTQSEREQIINRLRAEVEAVSKIVLRPTPTEPLSPFDTLPDRVKAARARDKLSQTDLADIAGVSVMVVSRIERAGMSGGGVRLDSLLRVCDALGIKIWLE
ncbi:MAG: helix-turn-helix domain-containing protein [Natronospirillum sp.]